MHRPTDRILAAAHGSYYFASGLWPLVSLRTFEKVTGPKADDWLVKTVGLLAAVIGGALLRDAARDRPPDRALATASAAAFAAVDAWYAGRGRISRIYLADAAVEAALVLTWLRVWPICTATRDRPA